MADDELERRALAKSLLPHVRAFYGNYAGPTGQDPFYPPDART